MMRKRPAAASVAAEEEGEPYQPRASELPGRHLQVACRAADVRSLAFGASGIGCLFADVPPDQAAATVEAALQLGIDYVDTAPWYGAGLSEARLGALLEARPAVTLSTKCGRVVRSLEDVRRRGEVAEPHYKGHFVTEAYHNDVPVADYTADGIRESFRQSCARLRCSKLAMLRLHDAEGEERFAAAARGGAVEAMLELRKGGQVAEIGLGMGSAEYALRYLRKYPTGTFDSLMLAGCWNLIDQDGLEVLEECQRLGVRVLNVGVFASGILWGGQHYKYGAIPAAVRDKAKAWQFLAAEFGFTLPEVAVAFALLPAVVERVAVGCSTPEEVECNVALCGKHVPAALWQAAKLRGLLAPGVPMPAA